MLRKVDLFPSSDEGETPTLLDPLERANLNRLSSEQGDERVGVAEEGKAQGCLMPR
jgi:hypothetical protein